MFIIQNLKNELQSIAETIKAITNVDVTIVNKNLQRVAGTGILKDKIGKFVAKNSVFHKCLITGKQYFITDPCNDPLCKDCFDRKFCKELAELCIPIKIDNQIIGILGMCIFDESTKKNFINKQESYKDFESRLSNLISTKLNEKKLGVMVEYRSSELLTLINSLSEGIVILDNNKKVITINEYMYKNLNLPLNKSIYIDDILNKSIIDKLSDKNFHCELGPIKIGVNQFIITSSPIMVKEKQKGVVIVFSDFNKMQESVLKASRSSEIVTFDHIIGESEALLKAKRQAIQVSSEDASILLLGKSGTGKEIFARAIHYGSKRKKNCFMAINCGAIPENLIESELFGYEKGAFTGANTSGKMGKFEIAKDGTIFLDEIGELPLNMQVKLLRVLEEKEITRVGGHTQLKVNPRIISATNKDLYKLVQEGKFREDLFYRLNVIPINIPPLNKRGYDIILLAKYFLDKYNKIYNKNLKGFTNSCEKALLKYNFPGNIRELRNVIEYAVNFEEKDYIQTDTVNEKINCAIETHKNLTLSQMTKLYEQKILKDYLNKYGSDLESKKLICKKLGIGIATLYRKLDD